MALTDTDVRARYNADGANATFAIPSALISSVYSSEIIVYTRDESTDPVTETLQTLGSGNDYTIVGTNVVFNTAPASGLKVLVYRQLALTQPLDLTTSPTANPSGQETAYDRLCGQIQQVDEAVNRSLKFNITSSSTDPGVPDLEASKILAANAAGTGLEWVTNESVIDTPASVTDNTVVRWNGTDGNGIQGSGVSVDDSDNMTVPGNLTITGTGTAAGSDLLTTDNTKTVSNKTLTSPVLNTSVSGTAVLDEDDMSSNSATQLATQQSIKAYSDSATQIMTNKTLTDPTLDASAIAAEIATPANPSAGFRKVYAKTDGIYELNSSGTETKLAGGGGSGSGGINYLTDSDTDFEDTIGNWVAYQDAAASSPADGTGGTASVTVARTTTASELLRGNGSAELAKDAANRQGEGASVDFTIDNIDAENPRVQRISFDYQVSANFSFGDFSDPATSPSDVVVYIYDRDGTELIQPSGFSLDGSGSFVAEFQPNKNNNDYRLIFHIATTNASAWDFFFDNVKVGPNEKSFGPAMTDWKSYTPTGTFTNTTYEGMWRRVGDQMELDVALTLTGTPVGTPLEVDLPSGYAVDSTKINITTAAVSLLGMGTLYDFGTYLGPVVVKYADSNSVRIQYYGDDATDPVIFNDISPTAPHTWATGDQIQIKFSVPISGWSSNTLVSSDADTRVVAAKYNSDDGDTYSNANILDFENVVFDTHSAVTTGASWKFTAPVSGYYRIAPSVNSATFIPSVGNFYGLDVYKNGTRDTRVSLLEAESTTDQFFFFNGSTIVKLNAGDYIDLRWNISSGTIALLSTAPDVTVSIEKISGPSQIAATETIVASAYLTTGGTANASIATGSYETIDFDTVVIDTHSVITTGASWVFTAPASGIYKVNASALFATGGNFDAGESGRLKVRNNGSDYRTVGLDYMDATSTVISPNPRGETLVKLQAGDTVDVQVFQDSGGALGFSGLDTTYVNIERIGI